MAREQKSVRKPATKLPQLRKKLNQTRVNSNVTKSIKRTTHK